MKKFIAIYCTKNLFRPAIYKSQTLANQRLAHIPFATHKTFTSEVEAEQFIFPLKIEYLKYKQQVYQRCEKARQQTLLPINQNNNSVEEKQKKRQVICLQQQQQVPVDKYTIDGSKDYIQQFFITEKMRKNFQKRQLQKIKKKLVPKQEQTKKMPLQPNNEQQKIQKKQEKTSQGEDNDNQTQWLSQKQNLKKLYYDLISYQSRTNKFQKSECSIQKKSTSIYYAFFDGCSKNNPGPSGAGYIVTNANGQKVFQNSINLGTKTNNQAEFIAFIFCLLDCKFNGIDKVSVLGDSEIVVNGVTGKYKITNKNIKQLNSLARILIKQFKHFQVKHVDRQSNKEADKLSRLALKKKCLKSQQINKNNTK